jgi:endoglucanase
VLKYWLIGSELAAETAAALAASSIIFNDNNKQSMLNHAKQLFNFAINYRGDYTIAVPQVTNFYK